jgi:hypothetical protein
MYFNKVVTGEATKVHFTNNGVFPANERTEADLVLPRFYDKLTKLSVKCGSR